MNVIFCLGEFTKPCLTYHPKLVTDRGTGLRNDKVKETCFISKYNFYQIKEPYILKCNLIRYLCMNITGNGEIIPCNLNNEHRLAVDSCGFADHVSQMYRPCRKQNSPPTRRENCQFSLLVQIYTGDMGIHVHVANIKLSFILAPPSSQQQYNLV